MGSLGDIASLLLLATFLQDEVSVSSNHALLLGAVTGGGVRGHGQDSSRSLRLLCLVPAQMLGAWGCRP